MFMSQTDFEKCRFLVEAISMIILGLKYAGFGAVNF